MSSSKGSLEERLALLCERRGLLLRLSKIQTILRRSLFDPNEVEKIRSIAKRLHCPPNRVFRAGQGKCITRGVILRVLAQAAGQPELIMETEKIAKQLPDRLLGFGMFPTAHIELAMDIQKAFYETTGKDVKVFARTFAPWNRIVTGILLGSRSAMGSLSKGETFPELRAFYDSGKWSSKISSEAHNADAEYGALLTRFHSVWPEVRARFKQTSDVAQHLKVNPTTLNRALQRDMKKKLSVETLTSMITAFEKLVASKDNPLEAARIKKKQEHELFKKLLKQVVERVGERQSAATIFGMHSTTLHNAELGECRLSTYETANARAKKYLGVSNVEGISVAEPLPVTEDTSDQRREKIRACMSLLSNSTKLLEMSVGNGHDLLEGDRLDVYEIIQRLQKAVGLNDSFIENLGVTAGVSSSARTLKKQLEGLLPSRKRK